MTACVLGIILSSCTITIVWCSDLTASTTSFMSQSSYFFGIHVTRVSLSGDGQVGVNVLGGFSAFEGVSTTPNSRLIMLSCDVSVTFLPSDSSLGAASTSQVFIALGIALIVTNKTHCSTSCLCSGGLVCCHLLSVREDRRCSVFPEHAPYESQGCVRNIQRSIRTHGFQRGPPINSYHHIARYLNCVRFLRCKCNIHIQHSSQEKNNMQQK